MSQASVLRILNEAMTDASKLARLLENPEGALRREGVTDPEAIQSLQSLLRVLTAQGVPGYSDDDFVSEQLRTTGRTADKFKEALQRTLDQIDKGYQSTMIMYQSAFYLGGVLIVAAAVLAVIGVEPLLPAILGGLGMIDFLGFFLTKPPKDLQASRANLAQLQAAYFNWFCDVSNWNSYLKLLGQQNQLSFEEMYRVSDTLLNNTERTLKMVEQYCDLDQPDEAVRQG